MTKPLLDLNPRWSIWDAFMVIAIVALLAYWSPSEISFLAKFALILSPGNLLLGQVFVDTVIKGLIFVSLIISIVKIKYSLPWQDIGIGKPRGRWVICGILQGVSIFFIVTIISVFIASNFTVDIEPQPITNLILATESWQQRILVVIMVSVIAPVSEELYFRGFLYPALAKRIGRIPAIFVAATFFGIMHLDAIRFVPIMLGGVWLTMLYELTASLYTPIVAHSVWNTMMLAGLFLLPGI